VASAEPQLDSTVHNRLRQSVLCNNLSDADFEKWLAGSSLITCQMGTTLDSSTLNGTNELLILLSGRVRLLTTDNAGRERSLLTLTNTGDFIGGCTGDLQAGSFSLRTSAESLFLRTNIDPNSNTDLRRMIEEQNENWRRHAALASTPQQQAPDNRVENPLQSLNLPREQFGSTKKIPLSIEPLNTRWRRKLRKYPHVFQQTMMDCGAACLAMISLFYGKRPSLNRLRELCQVSAYGTSMMALAEGCERLGFITQGLQANYEGLQEIKLPCICFYSGNHFVTLYEINQKEALIGDPAEGIIVVPRGVFEYRYSGYALEVHPTTELGKALTDSTPLLALAPLFRGLMPQLRSVFVASILAQLLLLTIPLFTQVIVDKVVVHQNLSMLTLMLIGMGLACIFEALVTLIRGYLLSFLAIQIDQTLIIQFYKHLLSLPLKFFEERSTGDLVARFAENQKIRELLSSHSVTVLLDALTVVCYLLLIACYNIAFAAAAFVYLFLFVGVVVIYTPTLKNLGRRVFNKNVQSQSLLIESIRGIEKIKGAAAEVRTRWKWEIVFNDCLNLQFKELTAIHLTNTLTRLLHFAGQIVLLWIGATLVVAEKLTIGQFMALNLMVEMMVQPMLRVVEMWDKLQEANIAVERIVDVLDAQPEETQGERADLGTVNGEVAFESVTFRYTSNDEKNTLLNVSFQAQPGQQIAIVGRSGSGKSTILKLIQGFYVPNSGKVLVDGRDLTHLSLTQLRRQIGVVSQQEYFFAGTVKDNLRLYNPHATMDELEEAARIAGVHSVICALPMNYETPLIEGGFNLSGGQRQRLAIARAILHHPRILIFDEATSALDSESEQRIQQSMEKIRENRTMFVVAHRLSTVRDADSILVLDRGQIVESGNHEELVRQKGLYYYLCSQQLSL
jgi:HlyB family type I secretion system ABC transporter